MTPEVLQALADAAEKLRLTSLFEDDGPGELGPEAEQYYLLALSALDQAHRFAQLSTYMQRQGR